jgi:ADP-heptose:LPS heptosyltransferase
MKTVLYLFNGNGWGDHYLALPFIKAHLREHGEKSILVITYKSHVKNIFKNINARYIGLDSPVCCFRDVRFQIEKYEPNRIVCFNAFYPFDFDCHVHQIFKQSNYFGYYNAIGERKKKYFENFAHIRDLYFLFTEIQPIYLSSDRKFDFSNKEVNRFKNITNKNFGIYNYDNSVIVHLDSEDRKLLNIEVALMIIKKLLSLDLKVICIGNSKNVIEPLLKNFQDVIYITSKEIRFSFWLITQTKYFIGIDSVFAHVADAYDVNGIVLFSDYLSHLWSHNSPNITTIYPSPGKITRDMPYSLIEDSIKTKFSIT